MSESKPDPIVTLANPLDQTPVAVGRMVDGGFELDEVVDTALWDRFTRRGFALEVLVDGVDSGHAVTTREWVDVKCRACGRHIGEHAVRVGAARFRCPRCKARTIVPWPPS